MDTVLHLYNQYIKLYNTSDLEVTWQVDRFCMTYYIKELYILTIVLYDHITKTRINFYK